MNKKAKVLQSEGISEKAEKTEREQGSESNKSAFVHD